MGVFKLGQMIAAEIGANEGVDTLGRWLSHYLAERLEEVDKNPANQQECVDLILKLWSHRASYPRTPRPLEKYEDILTTLERLDLKNSPYYFPYDRDQQSKEDNATWLDSALEIDRTARELISFCLAQAVKESELSEDPWMEASKALEPDQQIIVLRFLAKLGEDDSSDETGEEDNVFNRFISQLDTFVKHVEDIRHTALNINND